MNVPFLSLKDVTALHGAEINEAVSRVVDGGWYLQGEENKIFAADFAAYCGTKYALGVANGLDALRLIIKASGFGAGDEIIVPANTYIATILAISDNGCTPVLVEPDINTYNINPDLIEFVEETPDTVISFTTGRKIIVKESRQEMKNLVKLYRKDIFT